MRCLLRVPREGLSEKVTFEQRSERNKIANHVDIGHRALQAEEQPVQRPRGWSVPVALREEQPARVAGAGPWEQEGEAGRR